MSVACTSSCMASLCFWPADASTSSGLLSSSSAEGQTSGVGFLHLLSWGQGGGLIFIEQRVEY